MITKKTLALILLIGLVPLATLKINETPAIQQTIIPDIPASTLQSVNGTRDSIFGDAITAIGNYFGTGYPAFAVGGCGFKSRQGRVWIYSTNSSGIGGQHAKLTIDGEPNRGNGGICFGQSIANVGDVNGDNITDFVVGAPGSNGGWKVGKVYLFYGNPKSFPTQSSTGANEIFVSPIQNDYFGQTVVYVKDFNGDGIPDLAVGAPGNINDQSPNFGSVYIYYGNGRGFSSRPNFILRDNLNLTAFGMSLASGDINGDGLSDIVVGAPNYDQGVGKVDIFYGRKNATNEILQPDLILNATANKFNFGNNVAVIPDINKRKSEDLLISYNTKDQGFPSKVSMFTNLANITTETPNYVLEANSTSSLFGTSIIGLGDINNDSYNDFAIGAPGANNGTVSVYYGGPTFTGIASKVYTGESEGDQFGYSIAPIPFNKTNQLLIGALNYDSNLGRAYITLKLLPPPVLKRVLTFNDFKNILKIGWLLVIAVITSSLLYKRRS